MLWPRLLLMIPFLSSASVFATGKMSENREPTNPFFRTRVFCPHSPELGTLWTFQADRDVIDRADVIQFLGPKRENHRVESTLPLWSDGHAAELLMVTRNEDNSALLSLGHVTLATLQGTVDLIRSLPAVAERFPPMTPAGPLTRIDLDDTRSMILAPFTNVSYGLIDLRTKTLLRTLPLSPELWTNPKMSLSSRFVTAQTFVGDTWRVGLWDLDGNEWIPVPEAPGFHQLRPQFYGNRFLAWLNWNAERGEIWILDLKSRQSRKVWGTDSPLTPFLTWVSGQTPGFAVAREVWSLDGGPGSVLEQGELIIVALDLVDLSGATELHFPLPTLTERTPGPLPYFVSLEWSPWTQELFISKGLRGGLLVWNGAQQSWREIQFASPLLPCLNPQLAPEYLEAH